MAMPKDTLPPPPDDPLPLYARPEHRPGSLGALLRQLADDGRILVQQEIALAKAEVRSSVLGIGKGAALIGLGAAILLVGLLVLIAFLVLGLGVLLDERYWLSSLIVGGLLALLGAITVIAGRKGLQKQALTPHRTIETLRDNTDWARAEAEEIKRELTRSDEGHDGTNQW